MKPFGHVRSVWVRIEHVSLDETTAEYVIDVLVIAFDSFSTFLMASGNVIFSLNFSSTILFSCFQNGQARDEDE